MSLSNLETFLRSFQADTDLQEFQKPVREDLDRVQVSMGEFFQSSIGLLQGMSRHLMSVTGKKFRPTILLLIARMGRCKTEDAILAATVIELIHTATLIHDDTIDQSALRRGLPTLNALYNDQVSTIFGDYIYLKAFIELIDRDLPRLVPVVAKTTYRMTMGEILAIEQKKNPSLTEESYFGLLDEKTASLMGASAQIGAIIGGFDDDVVEEMKCFGEDLGRAYQVTDDLFDFIGNQDLMGKGVHSDLTAGKMTLPIIFAIREAGQEVEAMIRSLAGRPEIDPEDWKRLLALLEESGAIDYTRETALRLADSVTERLKTLPPSAHRDALTKAVSYAVQRSH